MFSGKGVISCSIYLEKETLFFTFLHTKVFEGWNCRIREAEVDELCVNDQNV